MRHRYAFVLLAAACGGHPDVPAQAAEDSVTTVIETFVTTPFDSADNVDGPAIYHGPGDTHWIIATAKDTDVLLVFDAVTGAFVRRVGGTGKGPGQLDRPNGIAVLDDSLLLVVERDNARVQGFRLPTFESIGVFGERLLRLPYGIAWYEAGAGEYAVYISDNYEMPDETVPPDRELGARVKQFRVSVAGGRLRAAHVRSFGDTAGKGVIRVVESLIADKARDRLLIAEEDVTNSHIKVYDLSGKFTGIVFGAGYFPQQAEGIALYSCPDSSGYWVTTDQGDSVNTFNVFDRVSFAHLGRFTGAKTRRTDGVALTQRAYGPFPAGAFFGSHLDAAVGALSWAEIARLLRLRSDCAGR